MGFLDRVLDTFKIGDDEDYDDGYLDYAEDEFEEDDYESKQSTKGFFRRKEVREVEDPVVEEPAKVVSRKVAPLRGTSKKTSSRNSGMSLCIQRPTTIDDANQITQALIQQKIVVLNLEGIDIDMAQRIIDFSAGSCYAIDGSLQKISTNIYIVTPAEVDISGEFQEMLSGAFGIPSVRAGYYNE